MEWTTKTISDLILSNEAEIKTGPFGTQLKAAEYVEYGTPVINVRNIGFGTIRDAALEFIDPATTARLSSHLLKADDIVFGRKGAVERHAYIKKSQSGWIQGSDCIRLRITSKKMIPKFLSYTLLTHEHKEWMQAQCSHGATMASLNQDIVGRIRFSAPNISEQVRIASILSAYDDLIENNTRRIAVLEKMARRIYEEWFVHFRAPGSETLPRINTPLGPVPKGWEIGEVRNLVSRMPNGKVYKANDIFAEGETVVVDQSTSEILGFHSDQPDHFASGMNPRVVFGDHTSKMTLMMQPFSIGPNTIVFQSADDRPEHYLFHLLKGVVKTREYKRHWSELIGKNVIIAPIDLTQRFGSHVQLIYELIGALRALNRNLRTQRDLLLPKLISGEIDVSEAPAFLEAAE
jgi:type I restriction enzyme, S subunit